MITSSRQKRSAPVFPKNREILSLLGENIKLACKRRGYSQSLIAERTGLSHHHHDAHDIGAWEYVTYLLALDAGINMAECRLDKFNSQHHTFLPGALIAHQKAVYISLLR